jgi:addiction module HigA family antidote
MRDNTFRPNYAIPPGETLQETLTALGMTQAELAKRIDQSRRIIKEIVRGKAAITTGMAFELDRALGIPASFWINLEKNYQETMGRLRGVSC